jgi:hypothetical protein
MSNNYSSNSSLMRTISDPVVLPLISSCHSPERGSLVRPPRGRRRPMTGVVRQSVSVVKLGAQSGCVVSESLPWGDHDGSGKVYANDATDDDDELRAIYRSHGSYAASVASDTSASSMIEYNTGTGTAANASPAHVRAQSTAAAGDELRLNMLGKRLAKLARSSMERSPRESVSSVHVHADLLGSQLIDRRLLCELDALVPIDVPHKSTAASALALPGACLRSAEQETRLSITSISELENFDIEDGIEEDEDESSKGERRINVDDSDMLNISMDSTISSSSGGFRDSYGHTTCEESLSSSVDASVDVDAASSPSPLDAPARSALRTFKKKPRVLAAIEQQDCYDDAAVMLAAAQASATAGKLPLPLCDFAIIQKDGTRDVRYVRASSLPSAAPQQKQHSC